MSALDRKLKFDDRFVYHLNRQIDGDCEGEPILFPDDTTKIKFAVEMSQNEFTRMLSAIMTGADLSYPNESHEVVWTLLRQVECPVSICEEILACLQPAFDSIETKLDELETKIEEIGVDVDVIQENVENNSSANPPEPATAPDMQLCGAAEAVVTWMHNTNNQVYADAEGGIFDNLMEAFAALLALVPKFAGLPASALATLTQGYFESQAADYNADYLLAKTEMVQRLFCSVQNNNNEFTFDVWGDWLNALDAAIPGNRAAGIFARYAPARQTFINQIAQSINGDISLQEFFDQLYAAFETGKGNPIGLCATASCGGTCARRYSDAESWGWEPEVGATPIADTAGWWISGPFSGHGNPNWVIGEDMTLSSEYTAIRVDTLGMQELFPGGYNAAIWYYDEFDVVHTFDQSNGLVPIIDGNRVTFIYDNVTPVIMHGWGFNMNQFQAPVFRVTGAQVCD